MPRLHTAEVLAGDGGGGCNEAPPGTSWYKPHAHYHPLSIFNVGKTVIYIYNVGKAIITHFPKTP